MTYGLIAVVVLIWGLVAYRIFAAVSNNDDTPVIATPVVKAAYNDYSLPKDTGKLQLNYRDPFQGAPLKDTVKTVQHLIRTVAVASHPAVAMNWNFIKYAGYLRNPASKKLIAFLTINNKDVTLAEGESADNVRLLKNMCDSVKISYEGKIKFIHLRPKNP